MKKTAIILSILLAFFCGAHLGAYMKKEKVIFVHKKCEDGECISNKDIYLIEESLDDINHFVEQINNGDTTHLWLDSIINRSKEINIIINKRNQL